MKTMLLVVLCTSLGAATIGAQNLTVSYLEGDVQVRSGSSWTALAIGDTVSAAASVRVQGTSSVQLQGAGSTLFLNRAGVYVIRDLLASARQLAAKGVTSALARSLRFLAVGVSTKPATASGARAADQGAADEDGWVESSSAVYLDAGKEYLKAGKLDQAIRQLNQALELSTEAETPEIRYYLASATALNGDARGAWKQIAGLKPGASESWHADFVLLKAKLLEDTCAYGEAVDWLTVNDLSSDARRAQLYHLLLGLALRGVNDEPRARQALSRAAAISADSELGKAANELLN